MEGSGSVEYASFGRRFAAGAIDALVYLPVPFVLWKLRRMWLPGFGRLLRIPEAESGEDLAKLAESKEDLARVADRYRVPLQIGSLALSVMWRNWRGPGSRLLRVRQVDARTGGPVTVRSVVIRTGLAQVQRPLVKRLAGPRIKAETDRLAALQPHLKEIQQMYADDKERQQSELMAFYREHDVNPLRSCMWSLPGALITGIPAWWSDRRQTVYEWAAGIVVIVEPRDSGDAVR